VLDLPIDIVLAPQAGCAALIDSGDDSGLG
jgi:hypothetical protein